MSLQEIWQRWQNMKKIEFKIIKDNSYANEINEILAEEEMDSLLKIKYIKYPDLFHSLEKDGIKPPIIVVGIDKENDNIVGVGACTVLEGKIGYLNSFRIRKSYRNKVKFSEAYRKLIEESRKSGVKKIVTTILSENKAAEKILTRQRKNMPIYEFLKNVNFYSIKNRNKGKLSIDDEYRAIYKDMEIHIKKKENKIYVAEDYKKIYSFLYRIRKIISFLGYPELPEKGKKLNFLYVEIYSERMDRKIFLEAVKYLQNMGLDCDFFMMGAYEGTFSDKVLSSLKSFKYKSRLYKVYYRDEEDPVLENLEIKLKLWNL